MNDSIRRLMKDFTRIQNDPPNGINATPVNDDFMNWEAVIFGPENTPWEGAILCLTMKFSQEYPLKPPEVRFTIYNNGDICLDILKDMWSAIYDSLLDNPNINSPANNEAAVLYRDDRNEYIKRVKEIVELSLE